MDSERREALEDAGFEETDVGELLGLSPGERLVVEVRVRLGEEVQRRRQEEGLTQTDLAERRDTTQSRISDLENGRDSVTIDTLVSTLGTLGADEREVADIIRG